MQKPPVTRRRFLQTAAASSLALPARAQNTPATHQATGVRTGEVTDSTAIVWTRLTQHPTRNNAGHVFEGKGKNKQSREITMPVAEIEGACPGAAGKVRLRYGLAKDLSDATETPWMDVTEANDFIHAFKLEGLKAGSDYHYASQTSGGEVRGQFHTAPAIDQAAPVRFCVMTCQGYPDRDHPDGHPIYPSMQALQPQFIAMTGDLVYYDNDAPVAINAALARLHWERMFSLPRIVETLRHSATYWLKDDHDTLDNDCWPGERQGQLTFEEGQRIFRQQAPMGEASYRTHRWGRDLQIWFTDGRDFRSPNKQKDGPEKTIWGAEQKAWFKRTVAESDATWKVLISPTPLVGPDRAKKNDNHANEGYAHEGQELRAWLQGNVPDNFFVICGDRHWQYHSVHPETGVKEFSVGAASNSHAGGTPGENPAYHKFHKVQGGFLSVDVNGGEIALRLRDVTGAVSYEAKFQRA